MPADISYGKLLLQEVSRIYAAHKNPRRELLGALARCARGQPDQSRLIDEIVQRLAKTKDLPWAFAAAYWWLLRSEDALPAGTVFTPPFLADEVVARLLPQLTVIDLGAGTGMLTLAAAKKGFRVVAIEQDRELAAILDALARILKLRDRIDLRIGDALSYSGQSGQQIMANPPYTRHHAIPTKRKRALAELARKLGTPLPMTAGYYAYFMAYAWNASWSDHEVLLVPTNWLEARYGDALRRLSLARGLREIAVVDNGDNGPIFDHALTTVCLVTTQPSLARGEKPLPKSSIRTLRMPDALARGNDGFGRAHAAQLQERLDLNGRNVSKSDYILGHVFRVRRGIATGANHFFVLHSAEAHKLRIPARDLKGVLRRLSLVPDSNQIALLWMPGKNPSAASLRRISEGKRLRVDSGYLCRQRHPWWRVDSRDPPAYFLSYMGRGKPKMSPNHEKLLNLNNIHGLYLRDGVPVDLGNVVADWLSSAEGSVALLRCARHYHGGLWKLEPGDVERLNLPRTLVRK